MKTFNLSDGGHMHYDQIGRGQPVVLLHGWGMRRDYFDRQVAGLSSGFQVVVPDLRGHGQSSHVNDGQGISDLMDDVAELLTHLDLSRVIIVGWSMGAMISWGLMQRPVASRIGGIVSIDMVPKLLNDDRWVFGLRKGKDASVFDSVIARMLSDWPHFTRVFVPRIFARGRAAESQSMIERIVDQTETNHPESMARLWRSMAQQDFRARLAQIRVPTLVSYGALSQLYSPAASEWVAAAIPGAKRVSFLHSGHAPHLEEADLFNREIEKFAKKIGNGVSENSQDAYRES